MKAIYLLSCVAMAWPLWAGPVLPPGPRFRPAGNGSAAAVAQAIEKGDVRSAEQSLAAALAKTPQDPAILELDAWLRANRGDFNGAETVIRKVMAAQPGRGSSQFLLGEILFRQGKLAEAKKLFQGMTGADLSHRLYLARIAAAEGDANAVQGHLKALMPPQTPAGRLALVELTEQAVRRRDVAEANRLVQSCAGSCAGSVEQKLVQALLLDASGKPVEAESLYRAATVQDPQSVSAWMGVAATQVAQKNFAGAEKALEEVRRLPGGAAIGGITLAQIRLQQQNLTGALPVLQSLTQDPQKATPDAYVLLSEVYAARKDGDGAYKTLLALTKAFPDYAPGFLLLGKLQMSFRNLNDADARFKRALELNPALDEAWVFRSNLAMTDHKTLAAEHYLREGLTYQPNSAALHFHLGTVLEHDRRWTAAAESFRKALEAQPNLVAAMNNRAINLARAKQNLPEAESLLRKALAAQPGPLVKGNLGYVQILNGQAAAGIKLLDEALQADPQNAEFYYFRSLGYQKQGNAAEAGRQMQVALSKGLPTDYATASENKTPALSYFCPMDKDVSSLTPARCPRCQMKLVPRMPGAIDYAVQVTSQPAAVLPDQEATYKFRIVEKGTNKPVTRFEVIHERPLHLFFVDQTLTQFGHEHPELQPDGTFLWKGKLPAGNYRFMLDFYPFGGGPQVVLHPVTVGRSAATAASLSGDVTNKQSVNLGAGLDPSSTIAAGKNSKLRIRLNTTAGVETYLGAWGHMLLVSEDLKEFLHAHPSSFENGVAEFNVTIPRPVNYRMWVQFQRTGKVNTFQFTLPTGKRASAQAGE